MVRTVGLSMWSAVGLSMWSDVGLSLRCRIIPVLTMTLLFGHSQVGDGTTSVVLLAGEFMKAAKPFIEEGVPPRVIIKAYRRATSLVSIGLHRRATSCW